MPFANPGAKVCDQGYGENAEAGADEKSHATRGGDAEREQREERGCAGDPQPDAKTQSGRGKDCDPSREQAEENSTDGHGRHYHGKRRARDAQAGETMEKRELRKDQEIDVGDGDEGNATDPRPAQVTP